MTLPDGDLRGAFVDGLMTLLSREQGRCEVYLDIPVDTGQTVRVYAEPLRIQGSGQLEKDLEKEGCKVEWVI